MSDSQFPHSFDAKPSLVPEYDDTISEAGSDITMMSSIQGNTKYTDPDSQSIYSYASSVDREFILKDAHGRIINNTNQFYLLPADVDEHARLDIQHQVLKTKMGALFWPTEHVRRILAPRPEGCEPPTVLDIGGGSGSWAIDMAEEFPHAEIVSVDLVPANLGRDPPPNCRFECDDVNLGLSHYKNQFDVVHMRCVDVGIEDGVGFHNQLPDLLRPGGILLVVLGNFMHGEDRKMITEEDPNSPNFSWVAMILRTYLSSVCDRVAKSLPDLVCHTTFCFHSFSSKATALDEQGDKAGAWSFQRYQSWMKEMTVWEAQEHQKFLIPMGPWKANMSGRERFASELIRQNFFKLVGAWRPPLLINGFEETVVDEWIRKAQAEILNMNPHTYVSFQASWALKPGGTI